MFDKKPYYKEFNFQHEYETVFDKKVSTVITKGTACVRITPADYGTWDSDYDYYGYREISAYEVTSVELKDSNEDLISDLEIQNFSEYKLYKEALEDAILEQSEENYAI